MSWIAQLLALYLGTLTLFPCSDEPAVPVSLYAQGAIEAAHNHGAEAPLSDICSPLCICTCCGVSVQAHEMKAFELPQSERSPLSYSRFIVSFPIRFPGAVFHPPKV